MSYVTSDKIPEDICSICTYPLKEPTKAVFKLACGHFFHNNCLNTYCRHFFPETKCPICRTTFDPNDCNAFWAFETKALNTCDLPEEVLHIYNHQKGGKRKQKKKNKSTKKNKSKKQNKSNKKIRKTKKQKRRYMK